MTTYIQLSKTGTVYVATPPYEREGKGKFDMTEKLNQRDLEYLYEQGLTNEVLRREVEETTPETETKKKKK